MADIDLTLDPADDASVRSDVSTSGVKTTPLKQKRRSRKRWFLYIVSAGIGAILVLLLGAHTYFQISEWLNPSGRVYVSVDGERQYLAQPMVIVTPDAGTLDTASDIPPSDIEAPPPSPSATTDIAGNTQDTASPVPSERTMIPSAAPTATTSSAGNTATTTGNTSRSQIPLPPLKLQVPAIDVDVPVVLADNQHLPRVPLAGWFFKSAFPATAGNTVILGHVNGNAAIFARLHELQPGDEIRVLTETDTHIYIVDTTQIVDESAVEVLAPTPDSVVTLITCAGEWNPVTKSFSERLVVRGHYAAVEDVVSPPTSTP